MSNKKMKKRKRGEKKPKRVINIALGYYVLVDSLNFTLCRKSKNGNETTLGYYKDLEHAISGLIREHEPKLADSDLVSYVEQLKMFKAKMIKDISCEIEFKEKVRKFITLLEKEDYTKRDSLEVVALKEEIMAFINKTPLFDLLK